MRCHRGKAHVLTLCTTQVWMGVHIVQLVQIVEGRIRDPRMALTTSHVHNQYVMAGPRGGMFGNPLRIQWDDQGEFYGMWSPGQPHSML